MNFIIMNSPWIASYSVDYKIYIYEKIWQMRRCGGDEVNRLREKQKYTDGNECTKFVRKIKYLLRAQKARRI